MKMPAHSCSITINVPPEKAIAMISDASESWLRDADGDMRSFKVIEIIPNKRIVWLVTDCHLPLNRNIKEWKNTEVTWEISAAGNALQITFMDNQSYSTSIAVDKDPETVFNSIVDVSKWWGGRDLEGSTTKLNDEFAIHHPGAHYSRQRLIEIIPHKRIVWYITEATLNWLKINQHEWADTRLIFDISVKGDTTILQFTHDGLISQMECYERVSQGWDTVIKDYLFNFISKGVAHFK